MGPNRFSRQVSEVSRQLRRNRHKPILARNNLLHYTTYVIFTKDNPRNTLLGAEL